MPPGNKAIAKRLFSFFKKQADYPDSKMTGKLTDYIIITIYSIQLQIFQLFLLQVFLDQKKKLLKQ